MIYSHSSKFIEKKLKKLNKQISKLEKEKKKLTNMYISSFPKEMIELVKAEIKQKEIAE